MKKSIFSKKAKLYIFIINSILIFIVGFSQYKYQEHELENKFHLTADAIDKELSNKISTMKGVVTSISSYYKSSPEMDSSSFATLGNDLLSYYNYIDGIGFATIVYQNEKDTFIQEMRDFGFYDFKFKNYDNSQNLVESNIKAKRYAPIIYLEPSSYKYTRFYGYDIYNDKLFHDSFIKAAKSNEVVIKDMVENKLGDIFYFFIKATYNGYINVDSDAYKFKNTNGFYIINITLKSVLEELREKFKNHNIQVISLQQYKDIKKRSINGNLFNFKRVEYLKRIDGFEKSHLFICKRLQLNDFNFYSFALTIILIILIQIIYVYILHKDIIAKNRLRYRATHDSLTSLYNRHYFKEITHEKIKSLKDKKTDKFAILFIDLDMFKELNDSFGHNFGDKVLIEISHRLNSVIKNSDVLGRHGGDEFLILLDNIKDTQEIRNAIKEIMLCMKKAMPFSSKKIYVTLSIGVSIFPDDASSVDNLLKFADSAMFKAKDEGRNTFKFYNAQMTQEVFEKVTMENKLKDAIKFNEFIVFYQPQHNAMSKQITGLEALVRWKNKKGELIPPYKFIKLAEDTGLIVELDRLVMHQAIKQFSQWKKDGLKLQILSLNLSTKQLNSDDFLPVLNDIIKKYNCLATDIELEITESSIMQNPSEAIKKLKEIRSYGFKLSIDDFGTGYSSLAYLKKLPINKLKIDKSFVDGLPNNEEDVAICSTVIALAKSLKLDLIAEGVEKIEQKEFLVKNGCYKIQGYYYAKPMDKEDLQKYIKEGFKL